MGGSTLATQPCPLSQQLYFLFAWLAPEQQQQRKLQVTVVILNSSAKPPVNWSRRLLPPLNPLVVRDHPCPRLCQNQLRLLSWKQSQQLLVMAEISSSNVRHH